MTAAALSRRSPVRLEIQAAVYLAAVSQGSLLLLDHLGGIWDHSSSP